MGAPKIFLAGVEAAPLNGELPITKFKAGFEVGREGGELPCGTEVVSAGLDKGGKGDIEVFCGVARPNVDDPDVGPQVMYSTGRSTTRGVPLALGCRCNRSAGIGPKAEFGIGTLFSRDFQDRDGEPNGLGPLNTLFCCGSRVGNNVPSFPDVATWSA